MLDKGKFECFQFNHESELSFLLRVIVEFQNNNYYRINSWKLFKILFSLNKWNYQYSNWFHFLNIHKYAIRT